MTPNPSNPTQTEDWVMVPRDASKAMVDKAMRVLRYKTFGQENDLKLAWQVMHDVATNAAQEGLRLSAAPTISPRAELTADFVQTLPGGKLDDATYDKVESALDRLDAPCQAEDGRWLSLHERVDALASPRGRGEGLEREAAVKVAQSIFLAGERFAEGSEPRGYHGSIQAGADAILAALSSAPVSGGVCEVCGGDCSAANPPVLNCPALPHPATGEVGT